jgi:hypothetical protein
MMRIGIIAGLVLIGLTLVAAGVWGTLALAYAGPSGETARYTLATVFALVSLGALVGFARRSLRWRALGAFTALFALLLVWWQGIEPSNDRDWRADVALLPYATVEGDLVSMHNIRNFDYRSETDYTPRYYDKRYDLAKLDGVDFIAVYWMGPAIAHTFMSFSFAGGDHLAISIETRTEKGEGYSTLKGFFRQYELYYVVADERDVIRLRTNYRHNPIEDVYVYRLQGSLDNARNLFRAYVKEINSLRSSPQFYNTLTTNCTTNIWVHSRVNPDHVPFSWKILASGYVPQYLFERGLLATGGLSSAELQRRVHVNARGQAADAAADFSRRIRLPE